MIGKLKGRIDDVFEDSAILDVGGVGYLVFCSTRTLSRLPARGEYAELITLTHVREDHIHLYGFLSTYEREWFDLLTTVQGVGVKMALAIQGVFTPEELITAIAAKDVKTLTKVSGVGAKLAERIATELKSKVAKMAPSMAIAVTPQKGTAKSSPVPSLTEDAISALVSLGYNRSDAFTAVGRAIQELGDGAALDSLIKVGLKQLARAS